MQLIDYDYFLDKYILTSVVEWRVEEKNQMFSVYYQKLTFGLPTRRLGIILFVSWNIRFGSGIEIDTGNSYRFNNMCRQ